MHQQNAYLCTKVIALVDTQKVFNDMYLIGIKMYPPWTCAEWCSMHVTDTSLLRSTSLLLSFLSKQYASWVRKNVMPKTSTCIKCAYFSILLKRLCTYAQIVVSSTFCAEWALHLFKNSQKSLCFIRTLFRIHVSWLYTTCEIVIPHTRSENTDWLWD